MKKFFAVLLAFALTALLLAGCGDKESTRQDSAGTQSSPDAGGAAAVSTPSNVQSNTDTGIRTTTSDVVQVLVASPDITKP
ncbi:MAG: hypothetical protein IKY46_01155 [Clostridia bacterium]|nr:hypothetical protein [Clostridia bacterium]